MGEIEEAKRIAQKYDYVYYDWGCVGGETKDGEDISDRDSRRLWEIVHSLKWGYVSSMWVHNNTGYIEIGIETIFGHSKLLWYEDVEGSQPERYADIVTPLGEHWFYARMDDGRFF